MSTFIEMDTKELEEIGKGIIDGLQYLGKDGLQEEHQKQLDNLEDCVSIQQFCIELLPKPKEDITTFIDRVYSNREYLNSLTIPTTIKMYNSSKIEELFTKLYSYQGLDLKDDNDWHKHILTEMVLRISDAVLVNDRFVLDTVWYNI